MTRLEVWSDAENRKVYDRLALGKCQGGRPLLARRMSCSDLSDVLRAVPFFINKKTEAFICGASSKEKLKEWAAGQASKKS